MVALASTTPIMTGLITVGTAVPAGTAAAGAAGTIAAKAVKGLLIKKILAGVGAGLAGGALATVVVLSGGVAAEEVKGPITHSDLFDSLETDLLGGMSEFSI
jgi:hypothetical protein